jgi:hypothetical protein
MRMLQAILRHQRRSTDAQAHQILPEIQDPLRQLRGPFLARRVPVAGPSELREGGGARPHLRGDGRVVGLLAPEGRGDADHELGFCGGEVRCEVVVVDPLPCLVGCAPVRNHQQCFYIRGDLPQEVGGGSGIEGERGMERKGDVSERTG